MQSLAALSIADLEAFSKCAQLYSTLESCTESAIKKAKRVIRKKGDINFQLPSSSRTYEQYVGCTLLHLAWNTCSSEITEDLLDLGADFTIKNENGETALHNALKMCSSLHNKIACQDDSHVNLLLSAHVKFGNFCNPWDENGFSHFHIACMANHLKTVQLFLENGVDINQAVDQEAVSYAGFTPLHFAVQYYSMETIEVLLKYGADKNIENNCKITSLHQILNERIELLGMLKHAVIESNVATLEERIAKSEKIIFMLLGNSFLDKVDIVDSSGLSSLHIACTMQDSSKVESLLELAEDIDHCINSDSPMWPGYTALHFAAHCNANAMKLLHRRGANVDVEDANGFMPFDICLKVGHVEDIHTAISLKPEWANILFSDNKTRLVNFFSAMRDTTQLSNFLRNCVDDINMKLPNNSPIWPGCTPLHLAVIISIKYEDQDDHYPLNEESILEQIEELLNNGADVTQTDASGRSPLHDAYRDGKIQISRLLLKHHHSSVNPVDEENLSHLHIACINDNRPLVEKILSNDNVDVNIAFTGKQAVQCVRPGWAPMNCAGCYTREMLIQRGATISLSDDRSGENSFHSACYKDDVDAVQRLLELGADVDLALDDGRTPLHIAVESKSLKVLELLLQRGADLIAEDEYGNTPLSHVFREYWSNNRTAVYMSLIVSELKKHEELKRRMENKIGITMLHIACYMLDVDEVRNKLEQGAEVDAQVHKDSKLWPGCTALHVLMTKVKNGLSGEEDASSVKVITELLLRKGANIAVTNAEKDTPLHISYVCEDKDSVTRAETLLKNHRDFRINPVNKLGITHFHLAIMLNCVEVVAKFLESGVNVNQSTDFLDNTTDSCTPLLMAIRNANTEDGRRIVDLLLSHGADVNLEDCWGNSPLLKVLVNVTTGLSRKYLIEKLLSHGANINSEDISGVTPFECLLQFDNITAEDIRFFVDQGSRVNANNPVDDEGYLGTILQKQDKALRDSLFEESMKAPDVSRVNDLGRTLIHNAVAISDPAVSCVDYVDIIKRLEILGYDIDDQDHAGQTALHLAAMFSNEKGMTALLSMGADVDIVDAKGKSAFSYVIEPCTKCENDGRRVHHHEEAIQVLLMQVLKLYESEISVSELNSSHVHKASKIVKWVEEDLGVDSDFYEELSDVRHFKIRPLTITLEDFLLKSKTIIRYSNSSETVRRIVDRAFDSVDLYFDELLPMLRLQHRRAVIRFQLVQATSSLNSFIGYPLPSLCIAKILGYLKNTDLKRLVTAMNLENIN